MPRDNIFSVVQVHTQHSKTIEVAIDEEELEIVTGVGPTKTNQEKQKFFSMAVAPNGCVAL